MTEIFAYAACLVLVCLALFQLALILGVPIGRFAWGGKYDVLPDKLRIGSVISIILYIFFAVVILDKAGIIGVIGNSYAVQIAIWVITGYFFVGIAMNAISRSKPERMVMTPVALTLAVLFLAVAIS